MRIQHIAMNGLIGLLILLAVGCSHMTAVERAAMLRGYGLPADMPVKYLGEVDLHIGIPKRVSVGRGKECTITAIVLTNGTVQFNLLYESSGEVIDGVKIQPYSEQSQVMLPASLLASAMKAKSWVFFPPMRPYFVVAMKPSIIPCRSPDLLDRHNPLERDPNESQSISEPLRRAAASFNQGAATNPDTFETGQLGDSDILDFWRG